MLELLRDPDAWIALLSLTMLEIVLGIDNLVFIAILTGKLPKEQQRPPTASASRARWGPGSCCSSP
jgi:predicted tellurium resistance membrane protein TerC